MEGDTGEELAEEGVEAQEGDEGAAGLGDKEGSWLEKEREREAGLRRGRPTLRHQELRHRGVPGRAGVRAGDGRDGPLPVAAGRWPGREAGRGGSGSPLFSALFSHSYLRPQPQDDDRPGPAAGPEGPADEEVAGWREGWKGG